MSKPHVIVVTATYRRPAGLTDLLTSLRSEADVVAAVTIVDNAASAETPAILRETGMTGQVLTEGGNLGCGGGVALGIREALRDPAVTHVAISDDDAIATPGLFRSMLRAMEIASADAVTPLILDRKGNIGWFPGPLANPAWDLVRGQHTSPDHFRSICGTTPLSWVWSPWTMLLVSRRAVETIGLPRKDFWFQGEDIEWTARITSRFKGVLAPEAESIHLPPAGDPQRSFLKAAAMLQNNAFTATRLSHGRRLLRNAPGNAWRFLQGHRFSSKSWFAATRAHWNGLVRGCPAGSPTADQFRRAWERLP